MIYVWNIKDFWFNFGSIHYLHWIISVFMRCKKTEGELGNFSILIFLSFACIIIVGQTENVF